MAWWRDRVVELSRHVYSRLVFEPLRVLYLNAPSIGQFGGWHGFANVQICGRLSGQPEMFWSTHLGECEDLVNTRFQSFLVTAQTLFYFFLLYRLFAGVFWIIEGCARASLESMCAQKAIPCGLYDGGQHLVYLATPGGLLHTTQENQYVRQRFPPQQISGPECVDGVRVHS